MKNIAATGSIQKLVAFIHRGNPDGYLGCYEFPKGIPLGPAFAQQVEPLLGFLPRHIWWRNPWFSSGETDQVIKAAADGIYVFMLYCVTFGLLDQKDHSNGAVVLARRQNWL